MKRAVFSSENLDKLARILWAATLLTLPVTSFRYFPGLGETTYVRPLAFYPLVLLLPILLIQLLRKKVPAPWPGSMIVLGTFLLVLVGGALGEIPCVGWLAPAALGLLGVGAVAITWFGTRSAPVNITSISSPPAGSGQAPDQLPPAS